MTWHQLHVFNSSFAFISLVCFYKIVIESFLRFCFYLNEQGRFTALFKEQDVSM